MCFFMVKNGIILSHFGQLKYDTIGNLLRKLDNKMKELSINELVKKKIYAVMVECLENIDRHKHPQSEDLNLSHEFDTKFLLELKNNYFIINTGNIVENNVVGLLKKKIETVNQLNDKDLKKLYRKVLLTGSISEKGGAGVGIIEMAKTTQNKIEYNFKPINKELSYYQIKLKISNTN
ncbi:MAG: hypothetical protein GXO79_10640 [Chlorobi bacterium]|nr:hypothetical protein [Chlorobiota bacterium]